jgi:hypothetical protein
MPTRKQRRRRAKDRRHEYEYVYVDEEGQEVDVEPEEAGAPKRTEKRAQTGGRSARTRTTRPIQAPSWGRVGRRALLFGPIMFIAFQLLERSEPLQVSAARTLFLLLLFLPFSYVLDSVIYRSYVRRTGRKD